MQKPDPAMVNGLLGARLNACTWIDVVLCACAGTEQNSFLLWELFYGDGDPHGRVLC